MSIADRLATVRATLTGDAELIAVSKTHDATRVQEAYDAGQRHFGESYAQELRDKAPVLPADIRWHFIGRLQRNKLKYIAPHAFRVHGLTHVDQAEGLVKRAPGTVHGLVNVNLGEESSKVGLAPAEVPALLDALASTPGFALMGLMCIPPFGGSLEEADGWFSALADLAERQRARGHELPELSMGMSADYPMALRHGARWIRVGTALFGPRQPR